MALRGAVPPPLEGVGVLELAAAGAGGLHESATGTYLLVAMAVARDLVLVLLGAPLQLDALRALPDALGRHLVDADDRRTHVAAEGLVAALTALVAVLEELGHRVVQLRRLLRLQVFTRLDLHDALMGRLRLLDHAGILLVDACLCNLFCFAVAADASLRNVGRVALHGLVLERARGLWLLVHARAVEHLL